VHRACSTAHERHLQSGTIVILNSKSNKLEFQTREYRNQSLSEKDAGFCPANCNDPYKPTTYNYSSSCGSARRVRGQRNASADLAAYRVLFDHGAMKLLPTVFIFDFSICRKIRIHNGSWIHLHRVKPLLLGAFKRKKESMPIVKSYHVYCS